jgi:hypothetical protein
MVYSIHPRVRLVGLRPVECQSNLVRYFDLCRHIIQFFGIKAYIDSLGYKSSASLKPSQVFPMRKRVRARFAKFKD